MIRRAAWGLAAAAALLAGCMRPQETIEPPPPADRTLHRRAVELQREDLFAEAAEVWRDLLDRFPETPYAPEALFWLAFDQAAAGMPREALATLGRLAARFPNGPMTDAGLLAAAGIHLAGGSDGDIANARSELEALLARFPGSPFAPEARLGLALVAEGEGRIDEARTLYADMAREASLAAEDRAALDARAARLEALSSLSEPDAERLFAASFRLVRGFPSDALPGLEGLAARRTTDALGREAAYAAGLAAALLGDARAEAFLGRASAAADAGLAADAAAGLRMLRQAGAR